MRLSFFAVCMLVCTASLPAAADQVTDQLDLGKKYYEEGDLTGAINELQFAIQDIRSQLSARYRAGFPDAPAGWVAADGSEDNSAAMAMFGGGTSVARTYTQQGGEGVIDATISVDNPMIQGLAAMLNNPAIMAANPAARRVRVGRENVLVQLEEGGDSGEATLVLGGRMLLQLQGRGLENSALLEEMAANWKLDELKKIAGM
ncbi:MAG TPA: hypothetical protein VHL31_08590 [Geminicoccus sp.]|uniref:hypothetical protein n=1 Tax=Geminicoccus sp. TaxID=2024832 RepID=UPI002E374533|nr:hypothetical protein [Geminicoccus sp.]HEX2526347.1 hypothetical protein [Geminicoccus sp.]